MNLINVNQHTHYVTHQSIGIGHFPRSKLFACYAHLSIKIASSTGSASIIAWSTVAALQNVSMNEAHRATHRMGKFEHLLPYENSPTFPQLIWSFVEIGTIDNSAVAMASNGRCVDRRCMCQQIVWRRRYAGTVWFIVHSGQPKR